MPDLQKMRPLREALWKSRKGTSAGKAVAITEGLAGASSLSELSSDAERRQEPDFIHGSESLPCSDSASWHRWLEPSRAYLPVELPTQLRIR